MIIKKALCYSNSKIVQLCQHGKDMRYHFWVSFKKHKISSSSSKERLFKYYTQSLSLINKVYINPE